MCVRRRDHGWAAHLAIFATVARLQRVAAWTCDHDSPLPKITAKVVFWFVSSGRPRYLPSTLIDVIDKSSI